MRHESLLTILALLAGPLGACGQDGAGAETGEATGGVAARRTAPTHEEVTYSMRLTSEAFEDGGSIPQRHTCEGEDVSPALSWEGAPEGTASFALVVHDPDAPRGVFCHWLLYNIPLDVFNLPEGASTGLRYLQGRNDYGNVGFGAPCPPAGSTHRYFFRLYALDQNLNIQQGATRAQVIDRMHDHILENTEMLTYYGRPEGS